MKRNLMVGLTLMLSGRAMTLAFIGRVGGGAPGDPPVTWLMPLLGDAVIGVSALFVAYLIARRSGLWVFTTIIAWNVVAIWDALAAFSVHLTSPWPDFFMLELFGPSMFFVASAVHLMLIVLASQPDVKRALMEDGEGWVPRRV